MHSGEDKGIQGQAALVKGEEKAELLYFWHFKNQKFYTLRFLRNFHLSPGVKGKSWVINSFLVGIRVKGSRLEANSTSRESSSDF